MRGGWWELGPGEFGAIKTKRRTMVIRLRLLPDAGFQHGVCVLARGLALFLVVIGLENLSRRQRKSRGWKACEAGRRCLDPTRRALLHWRLTEMPAGAKGLEVSVCSRPALADVNGYFFHDDEKH